MPNRTKAPYRLTCEALERHGLDPNQIPVDGVTPKQYATFSRPIDSDGRYGREWHEYPSKAARREIYAAWVKDIKNIDGKDDQ